MAKKKVAKRSKKKTIRKSVNTNGSCFVIMPFGGYFDDYYQSIFIPAIQKAGLTPRRADDLYRPSTIVADIWKFTQDAKVVLADLSGRNPNVLYELGLAHAIAKPAILVTESLGDVPFDLQSLRILEYDKNDPNWGATLKDSIVNSISEVLADPNESIPPAFLGSKPARAGTPVTDYEKELLKIRKEINLLRRQVRFEPLSGESMHGSHKAAQWVWSMLDAGVSRSQAWFDARGLGMHKWEFEELANRHAMQTQETFIGEDDAIEDLWPTGSPRKIEKDIVVYGGKERKSAKPKTKPNKKKTASKKGHSKPSSSRKKQK